MMQVYPETYLSPYVYQLLVDPIVENEEEYKWEEFLFADLTLNWCRISDVLKNLTDDFNILDQETEWYEKTVESMRVVYLSVHAAFERKNPDELEKFFCLLEWPSQSQLISQMYFNYKKTKTDEDKITLALLLTSVLERSLGDVFFSMNKNVPFLLRDLLNTSELKSLLGLVPVTFIQLVVGTPRGLNLRNVLWHGFTKPTEVSEVLISVLLTIMASIQMILYNSKTELSVCSRPFSDLSRFNSVLENEGDFHSNANDLLQAVKVTRLIHPAFKQLWIHALNLIENSRFGEGCMILLPQCELLLRCVFCHVNNCQFRTITAESETLYTTLDQIFESSVSGKEENQLLLVLSNDVVTMLKDLLSYQHGPRLRDKLSHGEIEVNKVSSHICLFLVNILMSIILKLDSYFEFNDVCNTIFSSKNKKLTSLNSEFSIYHPKFHILSIVHRDILNTNLKIDRWCKLPQPEENFDGSNKELDVDVRENLIILSKKIEENSGICLEQGTFKFMDKFKELGVTANQCRKFNDSELAHLLLRIVEKIDGISRNVESIMEIKFLKWKNFELRERERKSYSRMLQILPILYQLLIAILKLCAVNFISLATNHKSTSPVKRLKNILTTLENIYSNSQISVNRWLEIFGLASASCLLLEKSMINLPSVSWNE